MSFGNEVESGLLSWIFRSNDPFTDEKYNILYIGLSNGNVNDDGSNISSVELTGTYYVRISDANDNSVWSDATGTLPTVKYNKNAMNFATPGNDWGNTTNFFVTTTGVGDGTLVAHGSLFPAKPIYDNEKLQFPSSGLRISVN